MSARRRSRKKLKRTGVRVSIAVAALLIAVPAYAYSLLKASPLDYGENALSLVASAAGMSASVEQNPYNTLSKQLDERSAALDAREAQLQSRQHARDVIGWLNEYMGFISFFLSMVIFMLLSLNFYLDARRGIKRPLAIPERFKVDLRGSAQR